MNDFLRLLERGYDATAAVLDAIPAEALAAPSPCTEWTVREVANHLVGALHVFAAAVDSAPADLDGDNLGDDPAQAYRAAARRCLAAFARPGALDQEHPFPFGPTTGTMIANISLSESLVHGWDLARGAGVPYAPDPAVVDAVAALSDPDEPKPEGMFGEPVPTPPDASTFTVLLGQLGRRVA